MKKEILLFVAITIFGGCKGLWASQTDDFKYNKQQMQDEFIDLNRLEQTVFQNSFITLSEMQSKNMISEQFSSLHLTSNQMMDPALGIPGFWWGCLLGPIGIIAVYIISEKDNVETKKALTGCIVAGAVEVIFSVVYYVWMLSYLETGI